MKIRYCIIYDGIKIYADGNVFNTKKEAEEYLISKGFVNDEGIYADKTKLIYANIHEIGE